MKITIEIPDVEIKKEVFRLVTQKIADSLFGGRWDYDHNLYHRMLKEGVNAVLKERSDEIVDRCIPQAADYIGKKGVKKLVDMIGKGDLK